MSVWDRLTAKVNIITFSPADDKIQVIATIPEEEFHKTKKRFEELKSWKIIHSAGGYIGDGRIDLESTLPIKDYKILVNPLGRTDREYEHGDKSGRMAFWINARDGPPAHSYGHNLKCYGKNKCGEEYLPCFELRNENMKCDFYDKFSDEFEGEVIEFGEASVICWTEDK